MRAAFVNADVTGHDPAMPRARGVLVRDGTIEALLDDRPTGLPADVRIVDCAGGALVPGFHDCHVHLTDTGLLSGGHDVSDCADIPSILRRIQNLCSGRIHSTDPLYAGNYEEQAIAQGRPPTRTELDSVTGDVQAVLSRVDGHSCVVNSAAFARFDLAALEGVERDRAGEPTGRLVGAANYAAQNGVIATLSSDAKRAADERAAQMALRAGITTAHNIIVADEPFEQLAEHYQRDAGLPIRIVSKVCTLDVRKVVRLGGRVFGGDIFVDGSIGSRTAAIGGNYSDGDGAGRLYLTRAQLFELFDEAAEHGLSLGVHAIGDRAIEETIAAWESVIAVRGALADVRPSIDHFEIARPDQISRAARLGMLLSMQPAFDHLWGGSERMYEQRLGAEVAREMNLFASVKRAGCVVCGGSDSPVTPFSALLGIHSLVNHHVAAQRMSPAEALRAYTADAARLSFDEHRRGRLAPGYDADFTVLEKRLDAVSPHEIKDIRVLLTAISGEVRYSAL